MSLDEFETMLSGADCYVPNLNEFSYEGFSPDTMYRLLRACESDFKRFSSDIISICSFALMRGTKSSKMTSKMSAAGKLIVLDLVKKYKIKDTKPRSKDDVTLGRIMATFPRICYKVICDNPQIESITPSEDLPREFQFFGANALISKSDGLYDCYISWAKKAAVVIGSNPADVDTFSEIVYKSYKGKRIID